MSGGSSRRYPPELRERARSRSRNLIIAAVAEHHGIPVMHYRPRLRTHRRVPARTIRTLGTYRRDAARIRPTPPTPCGFGAWEIPRSIDRQGIHRSVKIPELDHCGGRRASRHTRHALPTKTSNASPRCVADRPDGDGGRGRSADEFAGSGGDVAGGADGAGGRWSADAGGRWSAGWSGGGGSGDAGCGAAGAGGRWWRRPPACQAWVFRVCQVCRRPT